MATNKWCVNDCIQKIIDSCRSKSKSKCWYTFCRCYYSKNSSEKINIKDTGFNNMTFEKNGFGMFADQ